MAVKQRDDSALSDLKRELKEKNPGSFYIFFGEETYLLHYYLDQLEKKLLDGPAADFNTHRLTQENFSLEALRDSLEKLMKQDGLLAEGPQQCRRCGIQLPPGGKTCPTCHYVNE